MAGRTTSICFSSPIFSFCLQGERWTYLQKSLLDITIRHSRSTGLEPDLDTLGFCHITHDPPIYAPWKTYRPEAYLSLLSWAYTCLPGHTFVQTLERAFYAPSWIPSVSCCHDRWWGNWVTSFLEHLRGPFNLHWILVSRSTRKLARHWSWRRWSDTMQCMLPSYIWFRFSFTLSSLIQKSLLTPPNGLPFPISWTTNAVSALALCRYTMT